MRLIILLLCFSSAALAQDAPLNINVPIRAKLYGGEAVTSGNVWGVSRGEDGKPVWRQRPADNKCWWWCEKPITMKKALLRPQSLIPLGLAIGGTVADVEVFEHTPCVRGGTCVEADPLLGGTRAQQYAVRVPIDVGIYIIGAWLRHGNPRLNEGGAKAWWIPVAGAVAGPVIGALANGVRRK